MYCIYEDAFMHASFKKCMLCVQSDTMLLYSYGANIKVSLLPPFPPPSHHLDVQKFICCYRSALGTKEIRCFVCL